MTQAVGALTRLFELAARSVHSAGHSGGLYPAQWSSLRYLSHAAPNDRTAAKLAQFQQLAVGPVTRTLRTLVQKGLIAETGSAQHHRSKMLELTPAGWAMLEQDFLLPLDAELVKLAPETMRILADALALAIASLHPPQAADGIDPPWPGASDDHGAPFSGKKIITSVP